MNDLIYRCTNKQCAHVWVVAGSQPPIRCPFCQRVRPEPSTKKALAAYRKKWGDQPKAARKRKGR